MTTDFLPGEPPADADLESQLLDVQAALRASIAREVTLRRELEHRVRNALAITRSVFQRTMDNSASVEDARDHFTGRLDAIARYRARFVTSRDGAFDLETMIWDELMVFASANDPRVEVSGPAVRLAHDVADSIGLALHELATNSVKHGVLGGPAGTGRLRIGWREEAGRAHLEWAETGVPIVASAPIASGFGREFIEQGLAYQLGAETAFDLIPGGLVCRIIFRPEGNP